MQLLGIDATPLKATATSLAKVEGVDSADGQGVLYVSARNMVWDPGTLAWVRETQPGGGGGGGTVTQGPAAAAAGAWPTYVTVAGSAVDPRAIRALTSADVVSVSGPVEVTGTFWQATQPVSGTVAVSGSVAVTGTFWQATQPVSGTVAVSSVGGTVTVSGSVSVSNFPATQPVSGTVTANQGGAPWSTTLNSGGTLVGQAAMASSIPVVIASNQSGVPVTGTFWQATQPVSGTVAVSGSVAVTGTFWQATQPVSGTVAVSSVGGTVTVSGSVSVSNFPATQPVSGSVTVSGTVTANQGGAPWSDDVTDRAARLLGHVSLDSGGTLVGQAAMANSLPVAIASDQSAIPASQSGAWVVAQGAPAADTAASAWAVLNPNQDPSFVAPGSAIPALFGVVGGSDGSLTRTLELDSGGKIRGSNDDAVLTELRMIRQAMSGLLLQYSGRGIELLNLGESESFS